LGMNGVDESVRNLLSGKGTNIPLFKVFMPESVIEPLRYADDRCSSYWLYTLRVKERAEFVRHMKKAGITVSKVHARNDTHTMFKDFRTELPGVDEFVSEHISIPVGWWLTEENRQYIINTVLEFASKEVVLRSF